MFLGPPGVGTTDLAISLAIVAAESGRRVYYGTLTSLVDSLEEAAAGPMASARVEDGNRSNTGALSVPCTRQAGAR